MRAAKDTGHANALISVFLWRLGEVRPSLAELSLTHPLADRVESRTLNARKL